MDIESADGASGVLNLLQDPLLDVKLIDANNIKLEVLDEDEAELLVDEEVAESSKSYKTKSKKIKKESKSKSKVKKKSKSKTKTKTKTKNGNSTTSSNKFKQKQEMSTKEVEQMIRESEGTQDANGVWSCKRCPRIYSKGSSFIHHLRRAHKIESDIFQHQCNDCGMDFISVAGLRRHASLHHPSSAKAIGKLKKEQEEEEFLLKDYGKKDEEGFWWCTKCGTRCVARVKFIYHLKRFHNINIGGFDYNCPHCKLEFRNSKAVTVHILRLHPDLAPQTSYMPQKMMNENGYQDEDGVWWCDKCGLRYTKQNLFVIHLKKFHQVGAPMLIHQCDHCHFQFTRRDVLQRHVKKMHPEKYVASSEESSESSNLLVEELNKLQEHGKKDKHGTWLCNNCSAMYGRKSAFIKHLKTVHKVDVTDNKFNCPTCDEFFLTQRALNDHMNHRHLSTDADTSDCTESSKKEDYEKLLQHGKKLDDGLWECNECSSTFTRQVRFIYHLKRQHNIAVKDFNYPCVQCNLSFLSLKALRAHNNNCHVEDGFMGSQASSTATVSTRDLEKIRTEGTKCEDGWECNRCGTKFFRDSVFMYHLKRYHGVEMGSFQHKCPHCSLDFMAFTGLRYHVLNKHPKQYDNFLSKLSPPIRAELENASDKPIKRKVGADDDDDDSDDDDVTLASLKGSGPSTSGRPAGRPKRSRAEMDKEREAREKQQNLEREVMEKEGKKDLEGSWWCNQCGLRYSKDGVFLYHLKRAHNIDIGSFEFKCSYCQVEFISKAALRTHINRLHPEVNENLLRNSSDLLQASILESQNRILEANCKRDTNNRLVCKMCGSKFIKDSMCLYHLKRDHGILVQGFDYKCNLCDMDYSNPQALRIHVKRVHGVDEDKILDKCIFKNDKWECKDCNKVFAKRASFAYHYGKYHETEDARFKYQCKICQSKYISPKGLRLHLVAIHGEMDNTGDNVQVIKQEYKPQVSGVKLNISVNKNKPKTEFVDLKKDLQLTGDIIGVNQDGIQQCQACGYLLSSRKNLMEHIHKVHPIEYDAIQTILDASELEEESFCKVCGHIFFSVIEFERHVKAEHKREECVGKLFECKLCVFFTMSQYIFRMHLKTIHGMYDENTPQWPCRKCGTLFDSRQHLLEHVTRSSCYIGKLLADFECTECLLCFRTMSDIAKHVEDNHMSIIVKPNSIDLSNYANSNNLSTQCTQCPYCRVNIPYSELYPHLTKYHSTAERETAANKHHECLICKKNFSELSLLKSHIQEEHKYRDDNSLILSEYAASMKERTDRRDSEDFNEFKCVQCGLVLPDNAALLAHIAGEHGIKKYSQTNNPTCSLCNQKFINNSSLRRHIKVIHVSKSKMSSTERKPSVCVVCSETFRSYVAMIKHFRSDHIDDPYVSGNDCYDVVARGGVLKPGSKKSMLIFKCKLCSYATKRQYGMDIHLINQHWNGVKPVSCSYCDFKTATFKELEKHTYTEHPESKQAKETVCLCDECGKTFNNKVTFYQHRESHLPPKYKCDFCNYTTHLRTSIDNHKRVHTQEKPFQCTIEGCNYSCSSHTGLKVHRFSHFPEKYMQTCDTCGFRTVNKYIMNAHMKEHKKGIVNFSCEHCSYTSNDKSQLSVHCKRHMAAKSCQLCDFTTKYKQTMKKHLKKRHGVVVTKEDNVKWF